jgi:glycine/D-amino acid oxidase-like deaminating enzyme
MQETDIQNHILANFPDVFPIQSWGETSFFYNPDQQLPRGVYFATLKSQDGANDRASALHRPGVFRLNMGLNKPHYRELFGELPKRPSAGGVVAVDHNFSSLDVVLPHPIYAWMGWICVLNPSEATFIRLQPLLGVAYGVACLGWGVVLISTR